MIRSLWISKTGLDAQQTNMDVTANNIANVNTVGYKSQRVSFSAMLSVGRPNSALTTPMKPSGATLSTRSIRLTLCN